MRRSLTRVVPLLALLVLCGLPRSAQADGPSTPAAPSDLAMSLAGSSTLVPAAGWIAATKLDLHFQAQVTSGTVTPQVEVEPVDIPFTGKANFQGTALQSSGSATVRIQGLTDGKTYRWQARLVDAGGNASPWAVYAATGATGPDFGVDLDPPTRPVITSPTDPKQGVWYRNATVVLHWTSTDRYSGVRGYTFLLERRAHVIPPGTITPATGAQLTHLADGVWFLALRAVDRAGNWSPTATFRMELDRQAPQITWLSPARFSFNPYRGPTTVRFKVSENSNVTLHLYRVGSIRPVTAFVFNNLAAGQITSITWRGLNRYGQPVPRGYYFFAVDALDRAGNLRHLNLGGIDVNPQKPITVVGGVRLYPGDGKRIIVVLSQETLYAYDGDRQVLRTYVTTGNPALPTPAGSYSVMAKYHPYEMVSPWPMGSPYWYPPSWMSFAMLFRDGGYFIHDAPWRSAFGPGTNGPGQPGTNYGGTHGCINVPPSPMTFLWSWTPMGTSVLVVP